jgi:hypothetical protein
VPPFRVGLATTMMRRQPRSGQVQARLFDL